MDIGQRTSRQRRHLPANISLSSNCLKQASPDEYNSESCNERKRSRSSGSRGDQRQHRMKPTFGNSLASQRRQTTRISFEWRTWCWRLCVLWIAFLCLRVVTSILQGDTTPLSLSQYILQRFSIG